MLVCENGKALYGITLDRSDLDNPNSTALFAAKELRHYLGRMTAVVFEISEKGEESAFRIGSASGLDTAELGDDGFVIRAREGEILIAGGKRGVIYGVYELLERLGCRFFTEQCEKIPASSALDIPEMDVKQIPKVTYREHSYNPVRTHPRFAVKCRFNGNGMKIPERMGGTIKYAWYVHSFNAMIPPEKYAKEHPEYFALEDGKRNTQDRGRTQPCLTNPDVLKICTESVREELRAHPEVQIISLSQNDNFVWCQCENCRKIEAEEGSPSGLILRFVNQIAETLEAEFPNVTFDTLAYMFSRPAPKITHSRKNVCVRMCSIESCRSHALTDCNFEWTPFFHTQGFAGDLRDWKSQCDNMYIWDYVTSFSHYPQPFPNWRHLQPNIRLFVENNVKGIFEQGNGSSGGGVDFCELRAYLISKLLWDPDCDVKAHAAEFMNFYYGAAAPALQRYIDMLCDEAENADNGTDFYSEENRRDFRNVMMAHFDQHVTLYDDPKKPYLRKEMLEKYNALFDEAAAAVSGDAMRLYRVEKARLSIRYAALRQKIIVEGIRDPEEINRFFSDWKAFGLSRIEEWFNLETTFRATLDGHWRGDDYFEHFSFEESEVL